MDARWTEEVDREADEFFAKLPEAEIRRRQDLCRQQIEIAHRKHMSVALEDLRRMESALTRAMLARLCKPF